MKYLIYNRSIQGRGFLNQFSLFDVCGEVKYSTTFTTKQSDAIGFDNETSALLIAEFLKTNKLIMDYSIWECKANDN